ncbi:MAG: AAA family ATPase [Promethearchaeota archaeon]|nr:MAG: AAA family ATPase [Candidatus Lokiarchaeota archaeon]
MISKPTINSQYIGPRAIFDPDYVPPKLLFRKTEENSLYSILTDSVNDEFPINILYQGIQGIGKKVIINKVIKDLISDNLNNSPFYKICVDCKEKNGEELIFSLLTELNRYSNLNFDFNSLLNSNLSRLWNIFKLASKKLNQPLFLIFNNIEYIKPDFFKKFLYLGKETNITTISTVNKILRTSTLDYISEFDLKKKLNYFSYKELNLILQTRASLTFSHGIDKQLIQFITDLIFEHYVPVPGKGIDILREIYPFLKNRNDIEHFKMLEICQNQFDSFQITDEFDMLNYISEEEILTIIFLDNLSNDFSKKSTYYIDLKHLKELYDISCESLEYEKDLNEFKTILQKIVRIGILSPSKKTLKSYSNILSDNPLSYTHYFMSINPYQLKAMVDAVFGQL